MKRYEYTITLDLHGDANPENLIPYFQNVMYPGYEIMVEGESMVSITYHEVTDD